jgi:hypothetical protein
MNKKSVSAFIGLHIIILAFAGCDAAAALFHGEKPDEPPPACMVVYNANGASGTAPDSRSVAPGSVITLPNKGGLVYSGNSFVGWNKQQNGTGITYFSGASVTVNNDITFYAQWISDSTPQYTLAFNANGATSGSAPATQTVYSGTSVIIPGQGTLAFSGKNFTGWNTIFDGSGSFYSADDSFAVTGNITLFAQWTDIPPEGAKTYTVNNNGQAFMDALDAINASSKDETHIIIITGEYIVNQITLTTNAKKTIVLRGGGSPGILYNNGTQPLFTISNRITLVLENNITLDGNQKYHPAVKVSLGGTLEMNGGAAITGARASGVQVAGGVLNMDGGDIRNNQAPVGGAVADGIGSFGGGVLVYNNGTFNLSNGTIWDNTAEYGGGVCVTNATFNMIGGTISGNIGGYGGYGGGGGVLVGENGIFIMSGGTISGNTAQSSYSAYGGGVLIRSDSGSFAMSGGTITGNTVTAPSSRNYGGGVGVLGQGIFTKNGGGTIDDTNSAQTGKVACIWNGGWSEIVRNTTAGPSVNMNSAIAGSTGGWE